MCTTPLSAMSLDQLALLTTHKRATPAVQAAFSRALLAWTRRRVRMACRATPFQGLDQDDVVQAFILRCLTRHIGQWQPHRCEFTAFLYRRLRGDVCDAWRRRRRAEARSLELDDRAADVVDDAGPERWREVLVKEHRLRLIEGGLSSLPVRQRQALAGALAGQSMTDVAEELGVHPSTMSRERTSAIAAIRRLAA
jgi:RNA polymerase sigma factor (sigma-70 family)